MIVTVPLPFSLVPQEDTLRPGQDAAVVDLDGADGGVAHQQIHVHRLILAFTAGFTSPMLLISAETGAAVSPSTSPSNSPPGAGRRLPRRSR